MTFSTPTTPASAGLIAVCFDLLAPLTQGQSRSTLTDVFASAPSAVALANIAQVRQLSGVCQPITEVAIQQAHLRLPIPGRSYLPSATVRFPFVQTRQERASS